VRDGVGTVKGGRGGNFEVGKVRPGREVVWVVAGEGSGGGGVLGEWVGEYREVCGGVEGVRKVFGEKGVEVVD
ncbi:hypothetical protein, partial [Kocuria salsicia]|uniref:hypothetical protein n=1 Tax=Kocuria salsicia TaxID=664639 RepID=UPI001C92D289